MRRAWLFPEVSRHLPRLVFSQPRRAPRRGVDGRRAPAGMTMLPVGERDLGTLRRPRGSRPPASMVSEVAAPRAAPRSRWCSVNLTQDGGARRAFRQAVQDTAAESRCHARLKVGVTVHASTSRSKLCERTEGRLAAASRSRSGRARRVVLCRGELRHRGAAAEHGRVRVDGDHVRGDAHRGAAAARRASRRTAM